MNEDVLLVDSHANGVCTLTLNRPEVHNAFDANLIQELTRALKKIDMDDDIRVVILNAKGKNFTVATSLRVKPVVPPYPQ